MDERIFSARKTGKCCSNFSFLTLEQKTDIFNTFFLVRHITSQASSKNEAPAANDYVEANLVVELSDSVRILFTV